VNGRTGRAGRQGWAVVTDIAGNVQETAEDAVADRYCDRTTRSTHGHPPLKAGGRLQRNAPHCALIEMSLNLDGECARLIPFYDESFVNLWKLGTVKNDVDDGSANGQHRSS
jgi:hypothetical protein